MIRTRNLQDWNLTRYRCANRSSSKIRDAVAVRRVGERDVLGLEDGLGARLDALERARHGERELHLRVVDREVGLGHGALLDELVEVARVALEAHVLVVDHVREHLVEELGVVRHDERRDVLALRAREEVAEPLLLLDVQVVRRLVEEQEIGVQEHGARERELHLPAARQVADGLVDELLRELHLEELLTDLLAAERREDRLLEAEVDGRRVRVGTVDVVVDEAGAELHELLGAGEARERAGRDGAHERGLTAAVVAEEAVDAAAAHVEVRRVEQDLAAVGELELDVAEDLALALGDVELDLALGHALLGLVHELFGHGGALLLVREDGREVGLAGLLPLEHVERLGDALVRREGRDVGEDGLEALGDVVQAGLVGQGLREQRLEGGWLDGIGDGVHGSGHRVGVLCLRVGAMSGARRCATCASASAFLWARGADAARAMRCALARAARRAPRALGQRDAIFCKGIFGCAARGRFYAALFGRQRGNGVRMLCTRARWFWCKWRRTRSCAVVCRRSGQVSPETTLRGASSGNSIFNLRLAPLAWSEGPPLPRGSP